MITCITATGDRPICFDLLKKWMHCQIIKPDQWIIIDDGDNPIPEIITFSLPSFAQYIRREPKNSDPNFTLSLNIQEALKYVSGDKIIFLEDDEYYAPEYIQVMSEKLDQYNIVGLSRSRYYHLPSFTYYIHPNIDHASLAQTAFKKSVLSIFEQLLEDSFIDLRLWNKFIDKRFINHKKILHCGEFKKESEFLLFNDAAFQQYLYVGMKGLPGRKGIGNGHSSKGIFDPNRHMLRNWITNHDHYNDYINLSNQIMKR